MKNQSLMCICFIALGLPMSAVRANAEHHEHERQQVNASAGHDHGSLESAAGQPGKLEKANRTIKIAALDTMRYDKKDLKAKPGETVRFVVTNTGKIKHEFTIGTREEQLMHAEMMASMPDMKHEEGNVAGHSCAG